MPPESLLPAALQPPLGRIFEVLDDATAVSTNPAWLGSPAPAHQYLHRLCPVAQVIEAIEQTLAQPVQHADHNGGRFATVLGAYLFQLEDTGTVLTWRWSANGPVPVNEHKIALQCMVSKRDWLMQNAHLLGAQLFDRAKKFPAYPHESRPVPPTAKAYAQWLLEQMAKTLLTPVATRRTQHLLQENLHLKDVLLAKANHLPAREPDRHGASAGDYNLIVTSAPKIEQIEKDSPLIASLYPLFCDAPDFAQDLEPAAALKHFLLENGLDQATWRAICAMGVEPLVPLLALYEGPHDKAMLDLLKCLRALRVRRRSQLWALAHLFSTYGAHRSRPMQYFSSIAADPILVHIVACSAQTLSPGQQTLAELDLVLRWAMDEHIGQPDKRQRHAGWPWLLAQATLWRTREQIRLQATGLRWQTPMAAVSIGPFTFEALQDELALWDEAHALHHCADVYGHRCRDGAYLIYSIRHAAPIGEAAGSKEDKRAATLALSRLGPRWTVDQLVGPANTGVTNAVERAALILVNLLNQQAATQLQGLAVHQ